jgi:rod shape-determining protein MreC
MESRSRDDFVIAIRSAFLKKGTKQRFSLVALIFFSILVIALGRVNFLPINYLKIAIKEIVYRSSFIVSFPENTLINTYKKIENHIILYNEFDSLKKKFYKIQGDNKVNEYIIKENIRLKKIFDDYIVNTKEVVAKVLIDKDSPFLKTIIINKGSKDNVILGMAVLDKDYLVGKVVEVNYLTARVLLLTDLNSKIPVTIEPEGYQAILSGVGKNHGIIQYSKEKYTLKEGSTVYTSGSGGLFKAGIPVGLIAKKNTEDNNEKTINFFSDFSQLKFVMVSSFKNGNDD